MAKKGVMDHSHRCDKAQLMGRDTLHFQCRLAFLAKSRKNSQRNNKCGLSGLVLSSVVDKAKAKAKNGALWGESMCSKFPFLCSFGLWCCVSVYMAIPAEKCSRFPLCFGAIHASSSCTTPLRARCLHCPLLVLFCLRFFFSSFY